MYLIFFIFIVCTYYVVVINSSHTIDIAKIAGDTNSVKVSKHLLLYEETAGSLQLNIFHIFLNFNKH